MANWLNFVKASGVEYQTISIDIDVMAQYVQQYLKEKYPDFPIDNVKIESPESVSENDSPSLNIMFELGTPDGLKEYYDGTELAQFLSDMLNKEVGFCTARDEYMDLWFKA